MKDLKVQQNRDPTVINRRRSKSAARNVCVRPGKVLKIDKSVPSGIIYFLFERPTYLPLHIL
jgi:hypothetical protein